MPTLELSKKICMVSILCLGSAIASAGQSFTTLVNFDFTNGAGPNSGLVQGTDGNLYGTTGLGGSSNNCTDYCGTLFKVSTSGKLTTLHSFDGTDGYYPTGLVQSTDGSFYGTTANGGSSDNCTNGCGTVFKITPLGKLTTLHSFDGADGSGPYSGLVQGTDGNFYGTTAYGGASNNCTFGCGTVFKITAQGALTTLHNFEGTDGSGPNAGLVQGTDGNFYGTTYSGGTYGSGTIFKTTTKGAFTTLHSFDGTDGAGVYSGLIQGTDGSFYGATEIGGLYTDGTIFKVTATGTLTSVYSFGYDYSEGSNPAGVVQGTDGNFYGATQVGGNGFGTIFQMTPEGDLTTLHSFDSNDGEDPQCAPVQATNGTFYGTAYFAGVGGYGTLFNLSMGLGSFVQPRLTMGKVGAKITILGNNLTGSTAVSFDSVAATTFKVVSSTEMTATVPSSALTGALSVTTPTGKLNSNGHFYVLPQLAKFKPASGEVGATVTITGVSLTQTSALSFNGTAASFTVDSDTQVTTTVPTDATTGPITITTAGGTVTSKSNFAVK